MPPPLKTKVEYDVSQAMGELDKLTQRIENMEKKGTKSFNRTTKASSAFESGIRLINPRAAELLTNISRLGSSGFVPLVGAVGAATAGIGLLVGTLVDVPDLLQKSETRLKAFTADLNRAGEAAQQFRDLGFSGREAQFNETLRLLNQRQADTRLDQARIKAEQDTTRRKLDVNKQYYAELKRLSDDEGDASAGWVADREHQPVAEPVERRAAVLGHDHEAGGDRVVQRPFLAEGP
jgi:hypothetical protein